MRGACWRPRRLARCRAARGPWHVGCKRMGRSQVEDRETCPCYAAIYLCYTRAGGRCGSFPLITAATRHTAVDQSRVAVTVTVAVATTNLKLTTHIETAWYWGRKLLWVARLNTWLEAKTQLRGERLELLEGRGVVGEEVASAILPGRLARDAQSATYLIRGRVRGHRPCLTSNSHPRQVVEGMAPSPQNTERMLRRHPTS